MNKISLMHKTRSEKPVAAPIVPPQVRLNVNVMITRVNIVRPICNNLVGQHHTFRHRALVGIGIMVCGVLIAKTLGHNPNHIIAVIGDGIGYGIHGIGLIPFAEALADRATEDV
jgi:hypothetical protein